MSEITHFRKFCFAHLSVVHPPFCNPAVPECIAVKVFKAAKQPGAVMMADNSLHDGFS